MNSPNLKYSAEYLHDGTEFVKDKVLVADAQGTVVDLIPASEAGEGVLQLEGLLCPGFINAHCHLELSHMRGVIPEHTGLVDFLIAVMQKRAHPEEQILEAALAAETEMLHAGIVAVGDISNTATTIAVKTKGRLYYHNFVETIGLKEEEAAHRIDQSLQTSLLFTQNGMSASVVPHAPYSVSGSLMQLLDGYGQSDILSIHNQESREEDKLFRGKKSGFQRLYRTLGLDPLKPVAPARSSLQAWLPHFTHRQQLLSVHNTYTSKEDIQFATGSGHRIYWCLCPGANRYIENRMPPVDLLMNQESRIILGTDSLASNHTLSILEEIKTLATFFPSLSLETMLRWATSQGAKALGLSERFGRFRPGCRPGIVQLHPLDPNRMSSPVVTPVTRIERIK